MYKSLSLYAKTANNVLNTYFELFGSASAEAVYAAGTGNKEPQTHWGESPPPSAAVPVAVTCTWHHNLPRYFCTSAVSHQVFSYPVKLKHALSQNISDHLFLSMVQMLTKKCPYACCIHTCITNTSHTHTDYTYTLHTYNACTTNEHKPAWTL